MIFSSLSSFFGSSSGTGGVLLPVGSTSLFYISFNPLFASSSSSS